MLMSPTGFLKSSSEAQMELLQWLTLAVSEIIFYIQSVCCCCAVQMYHENYYTHSIPQCVMKISV